MRFIIISLAIFIISVSSTDDALSFCYDEAGEIYGINSQLLRAIAIAETGENPSYINKNKDGSYDIGLMQINSYWIDMIPLNRDALLNDPCYNVKTGAMIMKYCIERHGYTWEAVGCYNARSKIKKVRYSWKVYRILKNLKRDNQRSRGTNESY